MFSWHRELRIYEWIILVFLIVTFILVAILVARPECKTSPLLGGVNGFDVDVKMTNNTDYYITISGKGPGNTSAPIAPGANYSWSSTETYNTKTVFFWDNSSASGTPLSQGNISFGPTAGVYLDRGWLPEDQQSFSMDSVSNGVVFNQSTNGGKQVLAWNEFENGGDITITYKMQ